MDTLLQFTVFGKQEMVSFQECRVMERKPSRFAHGFLQMVALRTGGAVRRRMLWKGGAAASLRGGPTPSFPRPAALV